MARVVVVHGINNTFGGSTQMAAAWGPPLIDGVALADGVGRLDVGDVGYVFYGDLFRPSGRFLGDEVPPLTADDVDDGLELELLLQWWGAAAKVDSAVVEPGARTLGPSATARAAVLALSGSKFLARVSERMLVWWLKQVTAYFTDPVVRTAILKRFVDAVGSDTRVVVAHSLGSVVAYEGLCAHPLSQITDLVTLGSPLGVPHVVFDRLQPPDGVWPGAIDRWVNICDTADFVALQPRLRQLFGERVVDVGIDNGASAHAVSRYLSAAETGAAIVAGLAQRV